MWRWVVSSLVLGSFVGGCVFGAECDAVVERLRRCDPQAASALELSLRSQCLASSTPRCAAIDVETGEGCRAFIACVYED